MTSARALIEQASAILLDFDGPVCSVFAGLPAADVARELRAQLLSFDGSLAGCATTDDPLEVLRQAASHSAEAAALVERHLAAAELDAIPSAAPTPGASEFLQAMRQRGTRIAIVSNNGEQAVRAYLARHALTELLSAVSARDPLNARLMKPNPRSLTIAMSHLRCEPHDALMIGDSESDIAAARAAEVAVIAYANRAPKVSRLGAMEPDAVIQEMNELLS